MSIKHSKKYDDFFFVIKEIIKQYKENPNTKIDELLNDFLGSFSSTFKEYSLKREVSESTIRNNCTTNIGLGIAELRIELALYISTHDDTKVRQVLNKSVKNSKYEKEDTWIINNELENIKLLLQ